MQPWNMPMEGADASDEQADLKCHHRNRFVCVQDFNPNDFTDAPDFGNLSAFSSARRRIDSFPRHSEFSAFMSR